MHAAHGFSLRGFQAGDESALHAVFHAAVHRTAVRDYTREQIAAWAPDDPDLAAWGERMRRNRPFVAVAESPCGPGSPAGEVIAGFADLSDTGYIDTFFVSPDFGGRGVGRLLMQRLHVQAAARGLKQLAADVSRTAQPFFMRHGFEVVTQGSPLRRGVVVPNARMRKVLAACDGAGAVPVSAALPPSR